MSRKILFFLSSDNFHAHIWKNGALAKASYFPNNAEGLEQFAVFLQTHHDPAYILVDLIEEDFRHEVVPHVTGTTQHELIQRKFEQYYRSTPFRLARLQRRQSEGRRDDEILFSALTNPTRISAWLDLLLLYKTPIAGIYSLPHVSIQLVKDIAYEQLLLLSWEQDAGLRQSYFFNKRLRFSRLTPLPPISTFVDAVTIETARTYQYLQSLSLTPREELLKVFIICHASEMEQLDERLSGNKYMQYAYLDIQQLSDRSNSKNIYSDSDATPLFLHFLAAKPPRGNYASAAQTHYYRLWQTKRGMYGMAAASALIFLVWSSLSFLQGKDTNAEADSFKTQTGLMLHDAQQITQKFPRITFNSAGNAQDSGSNTVTASDMKTAVTLFRGLQHYSVPPQQILRGLTAALDNFPRIRTNKLGWQTSSAAAEPAAAGNFPVQVITFNGELADFGNDYRGAVNYLQRFQLMLTRAGYSVTPLKLPLDFSTQGSISADIGNSREKPSEFSLKLVWRPQQ